MIQIIFDIKLIEPKRRVEGRPSGWSERGAEEGDHEVRSRTSKAISSTVTYSGVAKGYREGVAMDIGVEGRGSGAYR